MEAAVAEREAGMTDWNDDRLDEFRERVDDGFAKVDRRFERVEKKIDEGLGQVSADVRELSGRFDKLQHTLMQVSIGLAAGLITTWLVFIAKSL
jgi:hypothetical protein